MAVQTPRFMTRRYLEAADFYASAEADNFGAANLLDESRTQVWRADNADEAWVDIDLGEDLPVTALAVINHNLSYEGSIRIKAGADQGGSELLDLTVEAWECLWGVDECAADEHGADGYPTDQERQRYFPAGSLRLIYLEEMIITRWLRVHLIGPTWADEYNPAGLIQAGVILPGFYFQADRRPAAPLPTGPGSDATVGYSMGGPQWRNAGTRYRGGRYRFAQLTGGQALGSWWDLLDEVDVGISFVADFFPGADSQVLRLRQQLYCHRPKDGQITLDRITNGDLTLEVRESY